MDRPLTDEELADRQATYWSGLVWHIGAFVIINASFWLLDVGLGADGVQWAYWITLPWGFGLAFHVLAYLIDGRNLRERTRERILHRGHT